MKKAELKQRGLDIFRYLRRNGHHPHGSYDLLAQELVEVGAVGAGLYEQPSLTPHELDKICHAVRKAEKRALPSYKIGKFTAIFYDARGQVSKKKNEPYYRVAFPELDLVLLTHRPINVKWGSGSGSTTYYRDRWQGKPDDDTLMLLRITLPPELLRLLS